MSNQAKLHLAAACQDGMRSELSYLWGELDDAPEDYEVERTQRAIRSRLASAVLFVQ